MKTIKISLDTIDKIKNFVNIINQFDSEFDLVSGRYTIDAKSIMGIFSLDIGKPVELKIHSEKDAPAVMEQLATYIVE